MGKVCWCATNEILTFFIGLAKKYVLTHERFTALTTDGFSSSTIPDFLSADVANVSMRMSEREHYIWEKCAGVRQMRSSLSSSG
jgi:hypothetical protein